MFFNEHDRYSAQWLRNLWPDATVDERSIVDLAPGDIRGPRAHFFAGIGGWEYALQLASWPDDWPVWTGSCPCQPFSAAGRAGGVLDARHLWPAFHRLIAECRPPVVFGEQVASAAGRHWLAGVRADLEGLGYAVGAADLCAASVGAPHIRQRLFWVADAERRPAERQRLDVAGAAGGAEGEARQRQRIRPDPGSAATRATVGACPAGGMEHAERGRCEEFRLSEYPRVQGPCGIQPDGSGTRGWWDGAVLIPCADGKARRVKPGIRPLAHGISNRVGRLRAYGNAIVPQVAAEFVRAYLETRA